MSKMSDMTEYHASAYRLPSGFEHCSKLKPVAEAATALDRVKAVVDVLYSPGGCPWDGKQTNKSLLKNLLEDIKSVEVNEVFACGTAAIITPIGRFKSEKFDVTVADGGSGKLTCELRDELLGIQLGEVEDPHNWMWKVC